MWNLVYRISLGVAQFKKVISLVVIMGNGDDSDLV